MLKEVAVKDWPFLLHPSFTVLLTCGDWERNTITTIGWSMPASGDPPLVALALKETRFAYTLIKEKNEFALNVPDFRDVDKVWLCGTVSGKDVDKFSLSGFSKLKAERISTPLIADCPAVMECSLEEDLKTGDHHLILGQIILARADETFFEKYFNSSFDPCLHLKKNLFLTADWSKLREVEDK